MPRKTTVKMLRSDNQRSHAEPANRASTDARVANLVKQIKNAQENGSRVVANELNISPSRSSTRQGTQSKGIYRRGSGQDTGVVGHKRKK